MLQCALAWLEEGKLGRILQNLYRPLRSRMKHLREVREVNEAVAVSIENARNRCDILLVGFNMQPIDLVLKVLVRNIAYSFKL